MSAYTFVSVIIPNLHSPIINQTIDSLLKQDASIPFEIIVVGQDKFGLVAKYADDHVRFIETEDPTPPSIARNIGADAARGDYLVFTDADCVVDAHFLDEHLAANAGNARRVVGGAVSLKYDRDFWILSDNISTFHENLATTKAGTREILPSLNLSLPHIFWDELGGFDPSFPAAAGEDADFSFRAKALGAELLFSPQAIIYHRHQRGSLQSILQHAYTFGKYSLKFNRKYVKQEFFSQNPWALVLFSPALAYGVICRIVFKELLPLRFWHTLPVVFLAKIAWCFGARKRLVETKS